MNQKEFMQLVNPFKDKVFRMAKRLLVSTEEAEDATQEVLVKLWNKNESLDEYISVEAVAMTMTKNYCLDQLKSRRASNLKIVHNNFTDREAGLQQKVEDRDTWNWVEKIMNDLKTKATEGKILVAKHIKEIIEKKIGKQVSDDYIWDLFKRHNWKKKMPRTEHPKRNESAQEEFKKNSRNYWQPNE